MRISSNASIATALSERDKAGSWGKLIEQNGSELVTPVPSAEDEHFEREVRTPEDYKRGLDAIEL